MPRSFRFQVKRAALSWSKVGTWRKYSLLVLRGCFPFSAPSTPDLPLTVVAVGPQEPTAAPFINLSEGVQEPRCQGDGHVGLAVMTMRVAQTLPASCVSRGGWVGSTRWSPPPPASTLTCVGVSEQALQAGSAGGDYLLRALRHLPGDGADRPQAGRH